jgi:Na+:H+ antiporter, NhaA family
MTDELRHPWAESDRFVARRLARPAQRFMEIEAAGGAVMMLAAITALAWANSPWHGAYESLFETRLAIEMGDLAHVDLSLREWINDALMAIFFFVVGLEIKRELVVGQLRDRRAAALPAIAAVGGMVVPALLYLAFNAGGAGADGWGIPMATDIAFAIAVVSLLGTRVPAGAKLFLLTLAIVDDLGAIVVIAVFYTSDLSFGWLALAVAAVLAAVWITRVNVRAFAPYAALGALCWFALHESGVHATLAGVAFGFVCPAWSFYDPARFGERARALIAEIEQTYVDPRIDPREHEENVARLAEVSRLARETESPLDRNEHKLAPWVGFGIVPLFALANAGVALGGAGFGTVATGVAVGLVVGKTVGVFGATWLAVQARVGRLPAGTSWNHLLGIALCAGIGFTVALFVAGLSFEEAAITDEAKVGILAASLVAGVAGYSWLRRVGRGAGVPEHRTEPVGHGR